MTDKIVDRTIDQDCEVWQQHFWEDEKMRAFVLVATSEHVNENETPLCVN